MNREEINELLLHFLKTIYHYERSEIAEFSLSFQEIYVLQILRPNIILNIGEISRELCIEHFTASRLISRMQKKGVVMKHQDPADRRKFSVTISEKGRDVIAQIEDSHYRNIMKNLKNNPDLDIQMFIETARNIHKVLDTGQKRSR